MAVTCFIEDTLQTTLSSFVTRDRLTFSLGLLIGQVGNEDRDYVIKLVPTPSPEEDKVPRSLNEISVEWVTDHATQISRMLPGGLGIVGIYILSSLPVKELSSMLRPYLHAIRKATALPIDTALSNAGNTKYTLHIDSTSKKFSLRTSLDNQNDGQVIEIRWQSLRSTFRPYTSVVDIDTVIHVSLPSESTHGPGASEGERKRALSRSAIEDAIVKLRERYSLLRKELREYYYSLAEAPIILRSAVSKQSGSKAQSQPAVVDVLLDPHQQFEVAQRIGEAPGPLVLSLRVFGSIRAFAYVNDKEKSEKLAQDGIREDLIRSLHARIDILVEEWLRSLEDYMDEDEIDAEDEAVFEADTLHKIEKIPLFGGGNIHLPRRIISPWPSTQNANIDALKSFSQMSEKADPAFGLYLSPNELVEDSLDSSLELLGISSASLSSSSESAVGKLCQSLVQESISDGNLRYLQERAPLGSRQGQRTDNSALKSTKAATLSSPNGSSSTGNSTPLVFFALFVAIAAILLAIFLRGGSASR